LPVALKLAGSASDTTRRFSSAANFFFCSGVPTRVPRRRCTSLSVALTNFSLTPAVHEDCALLMD
jgi:hypothetical protein